MYDKSEVLPVSRRNKKIHHAYIDTGSYFPTIEVYGSGKVMLHGCQALLDFSEECLGFCMKKGQILIYGRQLRLVDYCDQTAIICGEILRIELADGGN